MDLGGENECCLVDLAQQDMVSKTIRVHSLLLCLFAACGQTTSFTQNQIVIMLLLSLPWICCEAWILIYLPVPCLGSVVRHDSSFTYCYLSVVRQLYQSGLWLNKVEGN